MLPTRPVRAVAARRLSRAGLAVALLAAAWWTLDLAVLRSGVPHLADDHWEDHLVARELNAGHGFRSPLIYPPLWGLRDPATLTIPVLVHGPLLPVLTAPALRALGPRALDSVAPFAAVLALLTVFPLFRLAARHFGEPVAAAAALLFTLSPLTLQAVHHSGSVVLGACLLTFALDWVFREHPRPALAGTLLGLALLVRPEMMIAALVLAFALVRAQRSLGAALRLLAAFAVVASPWWIHHARIAGSPFFNLTSYTLIGFWGARPDVSVMQDFLLPPQRFAYAFHAALPQLPAKWLAFFPRAAKNVLFTPSGATGWLAPLGLAAALFASGPERAARRRLGACALGLVLVPLASMTLTSHQRLYLLPVAPLLALGAAAGAERLARLLPGWARRPRAWIGLLMLMIAPSSLPALRGAASEARVLEQRIADERAALLREFPEAHAGMPRLIFSDTPDFTAWTTGRPSAWVSRAEFERLYGPEGEAAEIGLPAAEAVAGWFHDDFRDPASRGRRFGAPRTAAEPAAPRAASGSTTAPAASDSSAFRAGSDSTSARAAKSAAPPPPASTAR